MTVFSSTYDTATPGGGDSPTEADDRMREIKAAIQEREDVDHVWDETGTEVSDADTGEHRKVTLNAPLAADPAPGAEKAAIYTKDVGGKAELHFQDEDDNVLQLTDVGSINIVSADLIETLDNDTYFSAVDNAGTGAVDLIKANTSDLAALSDGAVLAAATEAGDGDRTIADKGYVDTKEDVIVTQATASIFGSWTTTDSDSAAFASGEIYKADSDGFIVCSDDSVGGAFRYVGYTDSNASPSTIVSNTGQAAADSGKAGSITFPVRKDDYWKVDIVTGSPTIRWLPIGTGESVKQ